MRRREFLNALAGVAAAWPLAARAQQAMPVIGFLNALTAADRPTLKDAFREGLKVAGYADGRNVTIEYRYANDQRDRLRRLAAELIDRRVDVIVATGGNNTALVAKELTTAIPIVFTSGVDPVRAGLVTSLSRPEANVTGVSWFASELGNKHLELLRELVPRDSLVAVILNKNNPEAEFYERSVREGARELRMTLLVLDGRTGKDLDDAFAKLAQQQAAGVLVGADPSLSARRDQVVLLAARYAIPVVYSNREPVEAGGLISFGNNVADAYRRAGIYTGRILKGAKPADLPIERATKFELIVNMKTARTLGLDIPLSLQMRIDEVIE
jgi:putative ABC transport system substrate-binding protein